MKKKDLTDSQNERIRLVRLWIASFIPLLLSAILFIFCFLFEREIWLYAICTIVFSVFVCLYIHGENAIKHEDGYTLIQAMHFYLLCLKEDVNSDMSFKERHQRICEIAKGREYAKQLTSHQIELMYKIGCDLICHFELERLSKYV